MNKAEKIYEWYTKIKEETQDWREQRDRCKKAYFGNQWESGVADRIRKRGQIDVVINYLRPLLRNRVASMIAQKPTGRIYGVTKNDITTAEALNEFMDWHWYNSNGQIRAERVAMGQQREGIADFIVYEDPKADYGRGELKIGDLTYRHVWVPKTAGREWDYSDSPYLIVSKLIDVAEYKMKTGKTDVPPDYFHPNDEIYWSGQREHEEKDQVDMPEDYNEHQFLREFDTYERFFRDMRVLYSAPTGTVDIIDDNYTLTDGENQLLKDRILKELVAPVPRVKYTKTYGEKVLIKQDGKDSSILPISHYPVIPVPDEDTGNAMPLGEIDHNFGVQELLNKCFSILVHNAALMSNPKAFIDAAKAGISDLTSFKEDWSAPGDLKDMKIDPQTGKFPIEIVRPEPLNQAFYTIFERLGQHLQFGMTTFASKLGDTTKAPDTYSATLQYGEWQQDNLRIPLSRLEMGIQRVFDIILEWAPSYYTFQKVFDVIGEDNDIVKQEAINEQVTKDGKVEILKDISKIKAKYRIRMGSTMPAQSVAYMNFYKELAQMNPVFLKHLVEYLPVKEKNTLIKELDLVQQLSGKLEQKETELNTVTGVLNNALRQQAESEIKKDTEETAIKLKEILVEQEIVLKEMKSEKKIITSEMKSDAKIKKQGAKNGSASKK